MQIIEFRDTCKISRKTGGRDEFGNDLKETVYEGACNYQEGGQVTYGIITRTPTMYLPTNDVMVDINDFVSVNTESGRNINSIVRVVRDVRLKSMRNINITRIELKQATDE